MNAQQILFEKLTSKDVAEEIKNSSAYKAAVSATTVNFTHSRRRSLFKKIGLETVEIACGTGGIGSVKIRRNGAVLFQFTCGHGPYNYAECAVLGHYREGNGISKGYFLSAI
jgi:hypothetical protein